VFEFLVGLYDKWLGHIIPTRFALFGTVGALGVIVQFAMLWLVLTGSGRTVQIRPLGRRCAPFNIANTIAALTAMTFNFVLNNWLTYADKRLRGWVTSAGWFQFACLLAGHSDQRRRRGAQAHAYQRCHRRSGGHRAGFGVELRAQLEVRLGQVRQLICCPLGPVQAERGLTGPITLRSSTFRHTRPDR
jgi:putative flippase GtrA